MKDIQDIDGAPGQKQPLADAGSPSASPVLPSPVLPRRVTKRQRDQRVRRFKRGLLKVEPALNDARFSPIINSFARVSILAIDTFDLLRQGGLIDRESGEVRSSVQTFATLIAQQLRFAKALNLTPDSIAKLSPTRSVKVLDLESMRDE